MEQTDSIIKFSLVNDDREVVFVEVGKYTTIDLTIARKIVTERLLFTKNKPHYLVVDATRIRGLTPQAKEFLQLPEGGLKNIKGAALIASNPVSALIANIFIKTPKSFQARFFSNRNEALTWIHKFQQEAIKSLNT